VPEIAEFLGAVYVGLFEMGIAHIIRLIDLKSSGRAAQVSNFIYLIPILVSCDNSFHFRGKDFAFDNSWIDLHRSWRNVRAIR